MYGASVAAIVFGWSLAAVEVDEEEEDVRQRMLHCNGCKNTSCQFLQQKKSVDANEDRLLGTN